jgi:hypothetical protein
MRVGLFLMFSGLRSHCGHAVVFLRCAHSDFQSWCGRSFFQQGKKQAAFIPSKSHLSGKVLRP